MLPWTEATRSVDFGTMRCLGDPFFLSRRFGGDVPDDTALAVELFNTNVMFSVSSPFQIDFLIKYPQND